MDGNSTHLPILKHLCRYFKFNQIIEFGVGHYSTPFFLNQGCKLRSIETNQKWYSDCVEQHKHLNMNCRWEPLLTQNELDLKLFNSDSKNILCFIDSGIYQNRWKLAQMALGVFHLDFIVVHDSEEKIYTYHEINLGKKVFVEVRDYPIWTGIICNKEGTKCFTDNFLDVKIFDSTTLPKKDYLR